MKKGPMIIIPIVIGIAVVLAIVLVLNQSPDAIKVELPNKDVNSTGENSEIQKKIDDIAKINLENDYSPKEREWQTSGPFQIDRTKYAIGEKIFLVIGGLNANEKGEVVSISRPFDVSNAMIVCNSCGKLTRVGHRTEGEIKVRYCKKCQAAI